MVATGLDLGVLKDIDEARDSLTDPTQNGILPTARRAMCDAVATQPAGLASLAVPAITGVRKFCEPYYNQNGDGPIQEAPPFSGGQCAGASYRVRLQLVGQAGSVILSPPLVIGPITALTVSPSSVGANEPAVTQVISVSHAGGVTTFSRNTGTSVEDRTWFAFVDRPNGLPDNCGDPPPEPIPTPDYSTPRPFGQPVTTNVNGDDVDVVVNGPLIDLSGDEYVEVDVGGVTVPISLNLAGGNPDLPAAPQPPASEGEPSEETDPAGELEEEPTPEEQEQGIETIGYRWNFPVIPPQQPPIPGTNPGRFPLIIGNLQLKYRSESGQEFWGSNYRIREQSGSLIREEKSLKVVGVSYWKRPDWDTIVLTPIKAQERAD